MQFRPQELLTFWFGPESALSDGIAPEKFRRRWYESDPNFDDLCRVQFGDHFAELEMRGDHVELDQLLSKPEYLLAYIIQCDQLPRNIFRGSANAFAYDHLALKAAREGVELGLDQDLATDYRAFFYMPFEHSESLVDQHTAVGLFSQLRDSTQGAARNLTGNSLRFAHQHRDQILRFARFPHRNKVLGRTSSPEELEFLSTNAGFGQ